MHYPTTAASSDIEAWRRFGGRHDLTCWLSRTFPNADGTRSGRCWCGDTCRECADTSRSLAALGLTR